MAYKIKRSELSDGNILREIIKRFQEDPSVDNLTGLFRCLHDSEVIVPVKVRSDIEGVDPIKSNIGTDKNGNKNVKFKPDKFKDTEGNLYLPVFSSNDVIDKEYVKNFTPASMRFFECMEMAQKMGGVKAIVVDVQSNPFIIKEEFYDQIRKIEGLAID